MTTNIQRIRDGDIELAYIIPASYAPEKTTFVTPDHFRQQLGFIVYNAGTDIPRHKHLPIERNLVGTSEVIFVKSGRCIADIYNTDCKLVTSVELGTGDTIVLSEGGHGFRVLEDTVLMEVKQGPYSSKVEKERF